MWNVSVSVFDTLAGRMIAGVLNLSSAHPVATGLMLAVLAALVCTTWLDLIGIRFDGPRRAGNPDPDRQAHRGEAADMPAARGAEPDSTAAPAAR